MAVYIPDMRVRTFTGQYKSPNDPSLREFIDDMKLLFLTLKTPDEEQSLRIIRHLAGEAKREVRMLGDIEKLSANEVFEHLQTVYGEKITHANIMSSFYQREQQISETIRQYALSLQEIVEQMTTSGGKVDDITLRDRFVAGLRNPLVKSTLQTLVRREKKKLSFNFVKAEAIELEREIVGEQSDAEVCAVEKEEESRLDKMEKMMLNLTEQVQNVMKIMEGKTTASTDRQKRAMNCFRCGRYGHFAKECRVTLTQNDSRFYGQSKNE